ncbi:uncharacterized protein LTR77_005197 [Saxophila tyrrhenica]|uniref:Uncharacterized protein n=1 Tax=Saxophila tyrrhenica TaxID=1690608 RepID=A0AAV9PC31_9PEZI|nr:hypothetical protein LTR77_005197 [Saxophila tyrrhenica]
MSVMEDDHLSEVAELLCISKPGRGKYRCLAKMQTKKTRCTNQIAVQSQQEACTILPKIRRAMYLKPEELQGDLRRLAKILICHCRSHQQQASQITDRWYKILVCRPNQKKCSRCSHKFIDNSYDLWQWPPEPWRTLIALAVYGSIFAVASWGLIIGIVGGFALLWALAGRRRVGPKKQFLGQDDLECCVRADRPHEWSRPWSA